MKVKETIELVHMPTNRTRRHFSISLRLLLSLILTLGVFAVLPNPALAVTSAEKQAEADEVTRKLDALQTELNQSLGIQQPLPRKRRASGSLI